MIRITLLDSSVKEFNNGITPVEVALSTSEDLAHSMLSAVFNGKIIETITLLTTDDSLVLYTWENPEGEKALWYSSAHIPVQVLEELYPGTKFTIGPAIANGFYCNVDFNDKPIPERSSPATEAEFLKIVCGKHEFRMRPVSKAETLSYYTGKDEYKTGLIEALGDGAIIFCDHDTFTDLCRGGHIPDIDFVRAVKVPSTARTYWRGDERNPQPTRVYGIPFPKQKDFTKYLTLLGEAKERDHHKLGRELELFTFSNKIGQGLPS